MGRNEFTFTFVTENAPPGTISKATFDGDKLMLEYYDEPEGDIHQMTTVPSIETPGLTDAEVAQRVSEDKTNDVPTRAARSVSEIVRANVFTRINAILVCC